MTSTSKLLAGAYVGLTVAVALLFPLATWGYLRHFHLARRGSPAALTALSALASAAVALGLAHVVTSAQHLAGSVGATLPTAAEEVGINELNFFGVHQRWYCLQPTIPTGELASYGGAPVDPGTPYLSFGKVSGRLGLLSPRRPHDGDPWVVKSYQPIYVDSSQVRLTPTGPSGTCPTPRGQNP